MNTDSTLIPFSDLQKLGRCPEALSVLLWLVENCAGDGTIATSIRTIAAGTGMTKNQVCKGLDFLKANRTSNKCPRFAGFSPSPTLISDDLQDIPKGCKSTIITINAIMSYDELLKPDFSQNPENSGHSVQNVRDLPENTSEEVSVTALDVKKGGRKRTTKSSLTLPYESEEFVSVWNELIQEPKWKKKSVNALSLNLKDLGEYEEGFAIYLMRKAIKNGTQGIVYDSTPREYMNWKNASTQALYENTQPITYQGAAHLQGNTPQRAVAGQSPVRRSKVEQNLDANREAFAIIDSLIPDTDNDNTQEPDEQ